MRRNCDRCGRWMLTGGFAVTGDWRQFCYRCLFAAAWEAPQRVRPRAHRFDRTVGPSLAIRAALDGSISYEQYVALIKRGEQNNAVAVAVEKQLALQGEGSSLGTPAGKPQEGRV